jgi:formate dehydrogenase major subunit
MSRSLQPIRLRPSDHPRSRCRRRPGSDHWEDIPWDTAIDEIARLVKKTRDDTFVEKDAQGRTVNRCEGIAWNGGCTDTNEFNYLVVKSMRSLGVCYLENQARV